jgi:6-phosphofructokinase 2
LEEAARQVVQSGAVEFLAVTMGRDGALLVMQDQVRPLTAPEVPVKSAVGAGDSFVAAMTLGLARGRAPEDAFAYAVAAGTAAVLSAGTGLCRRDDVERLYGEMRCRSPKASTSG